MKIQYFKEYSDALKRDMEFKVYGDKGIPFLVFPSQDGRFFDYENQGMVDSVSKYIENGEIQLFCVDSIDRETYSESYLNVEHRSHMLECYYQYIVSEIVLRIHQISHRKDIYTTGCSLGATHSCNIMLRRPDLFKGCICLSGYYDSDLFFNGYYDSNIYNNSPLQYLYGMDENHPYIKLYQTSKIILCCGRGAWEDEMQRSIYKMKELFERKNIPAWIDLWGYDVSHDWPWWRKQMPYFVKHILEGAK